MIDVDPIHMDKSHHKTGLFPFPLFALLSAMWLQMSSVATVLWDQVRSLVFPPHLTRPSSPWILGLPRIQSCPKACRKWPDNLICTAGTVNHQAQWLRGSKSSFLFKMLTGNYRKSCCLLSFLHWLVLMLYLLLLVACCTWQADVFQTYRTENTLYGPAPWKERKVHYPGIAESILEGKKAILFPSYIHILCLLSLVYPVHYVCLLK